MPVYTYQCDNCGIRFDQHQKFTDAPLMICPECNEPKLRKVYQPVGIVFKGSGFYSTDHRSPSGQTYTHPKEEAVSEAKTEPAKTVEKSPSEKASSEPGGSGAAD
jgi:putative FmdB family regulatory protein